MVITYRAKHFFNEYNILTSLKDTVSYLVLTIQNVLIFKK